MSPTLLRLSGAAVLLAASWLAALHDPTADSIRPWRFELLDEDGKKTAARIVARHGGDHLVPDGELWWSLLNQPGRYQGARYFYADGGFELDTAADELDLYVRKGLEYELLERTVKRTPRPTVIRLHRAFDMNAKGYYSGDGHIHPIAGQPDWARMPDEPSFHDPERITNELLSTIVRAVDLDYASLLSSNSTGDEVHFADRVVGRDEPESDAAHVLRISEEYRSEVYGHMAVFGAAEPSVPVFTGLIGSEKHPFDYPTNHEACSKYQEDGAFPSFAHLRRQPNIALEFPVDVALGSLTAVELQGYAVGSRGAVHLWEKILSCGFRVTLTAGTDATLTVVKSLPPGGARVYVDLEGRPFTHGDWLDQLRKGRAFTTNGAMLFLTIDGKKPGETISLPEGEPHRAKVRVEVKSLFAWDTVTLRRNSEPALVFHSEAENPREQIFEAELDLTGPAWIYAHLEGPLGDHVLGGVNPWWTPTHDAFTNPIWIETPGRPLRDRDSLKFMIDWIVDNLAALEARDNYGSPENRNHVRSTFERALTLFEDRLAEAQ